MPYLLNIRGVFQAAGGAALFRGPGLTGRVEAPPLAPGATAAEAGWRGQQRDRRLNRYSNNALSNGMLVSSGT